MHKKYSAVAKDTYHRNYTWNANHRLQQTLNAITGGQINYAYDSFGNLASAQYEDGSYDYKLPDEVGNLYRTKERKDRIYGKGGKLLKDENWHYIYDGEGNLCLKSKRNVAQAQIERREQEKEKEKPKKFSFFVEEVKNEKPSPKTLDYYLRTDIQYTKEDKENYKRLKEQQEVQEMTNQEWQRGDWEYNWFGNGMLKSVRKPDGVLVEFEYDALGRRISKKHQNEVKRYLWDSNVMLHEWDYQKEEEPKTSLNDLGEVFLSRNEVINNLVTWVYEERTFVPSAKIYNDERFSIISDYIGRPVQCYNENGSLVWETDYDIYGRLRNLQGDRGFICHRQLGQYEDIELDGLYQNRFRYYDSNIGNYISRNPIGLAGNNPNLYAFTRDSNSWVDVFGLTEWWEIPSKELDWTAHGNKHVSPPLNKKLTWSDVVDSTKKGAAKYLPGTNIEALERSGWDNGTPVTNGKTWKVIQLDEIVGASEGKVTKFMRVEMSQILYMGIQLLNLNLKN